MKKLRWIATAFLLLVLTGCGGSSGGNGDKEENSAPVVQTVEIVPKKVLLTEANESVVYEAYAYDGNGRVLKRRMKWRSTHPDVVEIDETGRLRATGKVGSSQIIVRTEEGVERSVIVLVTRPAPGVVLVDDEEVDGNVEIFPGQEPAGVGVRYRFVWKSHTPPSVGTLMLGTGTQPVAGRVVEAQPKGADMEVTLETVPVDELFSELEMNERVDMSMVEPVVDPDVAGHFKMQRRGRDGLEFVSRDGEAVFSPKIRGARTRSFGVDFGGVLSHDFTLGIFECKASTATVPLRLTLSNISVSNPMWLETSFSLVNHDFKVILHDDFKVRSDMQLSLVQSFGGAVECSKALATLPLPVTGAASWFFGFYMPFGIGFGAGGELELSGLSYDLHTEASLKMEVGFDCQAGSCDWIKELDTNESTMSGRWNLPGSQSGTVVKIKPNVGGFGFGKLQLGINPTLTRRIGVPVTARIAQVDLLEARGGLVAEGDFADRSGQLGEENYRSHYELSSFFGISAGDRVVGLLSRSLHLPLLALHYDKKWELAKSPKVEQFTADKYRYAFGDVVIFDIQLDRESAEFGWLGYNVERLNLYRRVTLPGGGEGYELIKTVEPAEGQTEIRTEWIATDEGVTEDNVYLMVETSFMPLFGEYGELEMKSVTVDESYEKRVVCSNGVEKIWRIANGRLKRFVDTHDGTTVTHDYFYEDINGSPLHYRRLDQVDGTTRVTVEGDETLPVVKEPFFWMSVGNKPNYFLDLDKGWVAGRVVIPLYQQSVEHEIDPSAFIDEDPLLPAKSTYFYPFVAKVDGVYETMEWHMHVAYPTSDTMTLHSEVPGYSKVDIQSVFDGAGKVMRMRTRLDDGTVNATADVAYRYDAVGHLLKRSIDWEGTQAGSTTQFFYDSTGKLRKITTQMESTNGEELSDLAEYFYNAHGDIEKIRQRIGTCNDKPMYMMRHFRYEYDSLGRIVKRTSWYNEGTDDGMPCGGSSVDPCRAEEFYRYHEDTSVIEAWRVDYDEPRDDDRFNRCNDYYRTDIACEIYDSRW